MRRLRPLLAPVAALAAGGAGLAVFRAACGSRDAMNWLSAHVTRPYKLFWGGVWAHVPFSMAEVLWTALVLACILYVVFAVRAVVRRRGARAVTAAQRVLGAAAIALWVYLGYTLLWGTEFYVTSVEEKMGGSAEPVSVQQLTDVTRLFAEKASELSAYVERDEDGCFTGDKTALLEQSKDVYTALEEEYPFLEAPHRAPKPMAYSRLMSEMQYTGFFFPFTGEANVNVHMPVCFLPVTAAHELSHVRGVAPEQTANFLAILACDSCDIPEFEYSGALFGYLHLSNALYTADPEAWAEIWATLSDGARADLAQNNAYWDQFSSPVTTVANTAYDGFLKSYGQEQGMKSYGDVVDLLVAWYEDEASQ